MLSIKMAIYASLTAFIVSLLNWVIDAIFITGFVAGW